MKRLTLIAALVVVAGCETTAPVVATNEFDVAVAASNAALAACQVQLEDTTADAVEAREQRDYNNEKRVDFLNGWNRALRAQEVCEAKLANAESRVTVQEKSTTTTESERRTHTH